MEPKPRTTHTLSLPARSAASFGRLLVLIAFAGTASAQSLVDYDSNADLISTMCALNNPAVASGDGVCPAGPPAAVPARPPSAFPAGAVTANHPRRLVLLTNGVTDIVRSTHPLQGCPGTGMVFPPLPIPALYAPAVAPITGMTMNPATQTIFLTDGFLLSEHDPAAGMALVGGPWATVALNFITGLDFDSCTGNLLAVDPYGAVAELQITPFGLVAVSYTAWPFPMLLLGGAQATGVAIDRGAAHPCGAGVPTYYVSWTSGQVIQSSGNAVATAGPNPQGLSFAAVPIALPSPAGAAVSVVSTEYTHALQPFALDLCNIPGGMIAAILGVSLNHVPGGSPAFGETLWLNPAAMFPAIGAPIIGTSASVPVPPLSYGTRFFGQWAMFTAVGTVELSDALQVEISRP